MDGERRVTASEQNSRRTSRVRVSWWFVLTVPPPHRTHIYTRMRCLHCCTHIFFAPAFLGLGVVTWQIALAGQKYRCGISLPLRRGFAAAYGRFLFALLIAANDGAGVVVESNPVACCVRTCGTDCGGTFAASGASVWR